MDAAQPFKPRPHDAPAAGGVGWLLRACGLLVVAGVCLSVAAAVPTHVRPVVTGSLDGEPVAPADRWGLGVGGVISMALFGWLLFLGVRVARRPDRGALTIVSAVLGLAVLAAVMTACEAVAGWFGRDLYDPSDGWTDLMMYGALGAAGLAGVAFHWKVAKAAGWRDPATPWWGERNIRSACGLLSVLVLFAGVGLLDAPALREAEPLGFFGLIVACLMVARWLPALLVRLTHAPRDPFPPRRNRGFRLW